MFSLKKTKQAFFKKSYSAKLYNTNYRAYEKKSIVN